MSQPTNDELKLFPRSTLLRRVNNLYMAVAYLKAQLFKNRLRTHTEILDVIAKAEDYELQGMPPKAEQLKERRGCRE